MISPGQQIETLCQQAQHELLFVAPFIKISALERLLSHIGREPHLQCVTRWRPEEIVSGVSDIEIWTILKARKNSTLWLRPDLHAKYYRADNECLVGSANITATALGWKSNPNLELLIPSSSDNPLLIEFERHLMSGIIQVDDSIYQQIVSLVEILEANKPPVDTKSEVRFLDDEETEEEISLEAWLPTLRHPEKLYAAYIGDLDKLGTGSRISAIQDLQILNIPPGLPQKSFKGYVGMVLLQMPIIHKVDQFVVTPQRFGAVRDLLSNQPCATHNFDANHAWQTLMRWLLHFLPNRYRLDQPRHSEIFSRVD